MAKNRQSASAKFSVETVEVERVEIFRAGDYGDKGRYGVEELDQIAGGYCFDEHSAPVTIDHAQSGPAFGWVSKVWREGEKLFASLKQVNRKFWSAVQRGEYKTRSVEVFSANGQMRLKAVSFLGAAIPHVKGMAEPLFSESIPKAIALDWADAREFAFAAFGMDVSDPDPASHGVIARQLTTAEIMGHCHAALVDSEGNGFTSGPLARDEYYNLAPDGDEAPHQHAIREGVVQPAGAIPHTHALDLYADQVKGEQAMSQPNPKPEPAALPAAVDPAKFAQLEASFAETVKALKAAEERAAALEKSLSAVERELRLERNEKRFAEAFGEALNEGRVAPAQREAERAAYLAACEAQVGRQFSEGEKPLADLLLESLKARPVAIPLGQHGKPGGGARSFSGETAEASAATRAREIQNEAAKAGRPIEFSQALTAAARENGAYAIPGAR